MPAKGWLGFWIPLGGRAQKGVMERDVDGPLIRFTMIPPVASTLLLVVREKIRDAGNKPSQSWS